MYLLSLVLIHVCFAVSIPMECLVGEESVLSVKRGPSLSRSERSIELATKIDRKSAQLQRKRKRVDDKSYDWSLFSSSLLGGKKRERTGRSKGLGGWKRRGERRAINQDDEE